MRALITGAGGFVGGHLASYLLENTGWEIVGTVHESAASFAGSRVQAVGIDLRDAGAVRALIAQVVPHVIFHLAAQSSVSASFSHPWPTLENNVRAELNVLEAVRQLGVPCRILVVGSNEEYGAPEPDELPQTEESPLRPTNPYAVSKVTQDLLGLQYFLAYELHVVRVRPYNHTGPGQAPRFVTPAFASQIACIEAGLQPPVMNVGNLAASRDFSDVRDIVRGYHLAIMDGEAGEVYNLASEHPRSIRDVLDTLLSFTDVDVRVERDPERYRPVDVPIVYGSARKLRQRTGWRAEIPFETTLRDVLDDWRVKARTSQRA